MKIEARHNKDPRNKFEESHPVELHLDTGKKGQRLGLTPREAMDLFESLERALDDWAVIVPHGKVYVEKP